MRTSHPYEGVVWKVRPSSSSTSAGSLCLSLYPSNGFIREDIARPPAGTTPTLPRFTLSGDV